MNKILGILVVAAMMSVVIFATTIPDDATSCGVTDNKMWFFGDDGTYVEWYGNMSTPGWEHITENRDSMQEYCADEISKINR